MNFSNNKFYGSFFSFLMGLYFTKYSVLIGSLFSHSWALNLIGSSASGLIQTKVFIWFRFKQRHSSGLSFNKGLHLVLGENKGIHMVWSHYKQRYQFNKSVHLVSLVFLSTLIPDQGEEGCLHRYLWRSPVWHIACGSLHQGAAQMPHAVMQRWKIQC